MLKNFNKKSSYFWMLGAGALLIILVFLGWLLKQSSQPTQLPPFPLEAVKTVPKTAALEAITAETALDLAFKEAKSNWQKDAALVEMRSGSDVALDGRSLKWEVDFYSPKLMNSPKKEGYRVLVENGKVFQQPKAQSIIRIASFPAPAAKWISSQQAIDKALVEFRQTEPIIKNLKLFSMGSDWYWAIESNKGAVTIKANL